MKESTYRLVMLDHGGMLIEDSYDVMGRLKRSWLVNGSGDFYFDSATLMGFASDGRVIKNQFHVENMRELQITPDIHDMLEEQGIRLTDYNQSMEFLTTNCKDRFVTLVKNGAIPRKRGKIWNSIRSFMMKKR